MAELPFFCDNFNLPFKAILQYHSKLHHRPYFPWKLYTLITKISRMCIWTNGLHICGIRVGQVDRIFCHYYELKVAVVTYPSNDPPSQAIERYVRYLEGECARCIIHHERTIIFPGCAACCTVAVDDHVDFRDYPVPAGWRWDGQWYRLFSFATWLKAINERMCMDFDQDWSACLEKGTTKSLGRRVGKYSTWQEQRSLELAIQRHCIQCQ